MRLLTYVMLIFAISIGLKLAGVITPVTTVTGLVGIFFTGGNLTTAFYASPLYNQIFLLFTTAAVAGGIIVGFFTKSSPEIYLLAPIAAVFVGFIGDVIAFANVIQDSGYEFLYYMFLPLYIIFTVGYAIAVIDWWRGAV